MVDGVDYNIREFIIPQDAEAWIVGKPARGEITKTDEGLFLSLHSPNALIRFFKKYLPALLILIIFFILAGTWFSASFAFGLLRRKRKGARIFQTVTLNRMLLTLATLWVLTGILFFSFSQETLSAKTGIGCCIVVLAGIESKFRFGLHFLLFPPALGLCFLGARFLHASLFTLGPRSLSVALGFLCLAAAAVLIQVYRIVTTKKDKADGTRHAESLTPGWRG